MGSASAQSLRSVARDGLPNRKCHKAWQNEANCEALAGQGRCVRQFTGGANFEWSLALLAKNKTVLLFTGASTLPSL